MSPAADEAAAAQGTGPRRCPELPPRGTLTCHSFGSAAELGPGAFRQHFWGLVIFRGFLLLRHRGAGGRPGLRRWHRRDRPRGRARGLGHLCKRNGVRAEPPGATRTPSPAPDTAHGTGQGVRALIPKPHPCRTQEKGKSWSTRRDLGLLGTGTAAASPRSCSPRCSASGSAAPSQKPSQALTFLLQKAEGSGYTPQLKLDFSSPFP